MIFRLAVGDGLQQIDSRLMKPGPVSMMSETVSVRSSPSLTVANISSATDSMINLPPGWQEFKTNGKTLFFYHEKHPDDKWYQAWSKRLEQLYFHCPTYPDSSVFNLQDVAIPSDV